MSDTITTDPHVNAAALAYRALDGALVHAQRCMDEDTSEPAYCVVDNATVQTIMRSVDTLRHLGALPTDPAILAHVMGAARAIGEA